MKRWNTCSKDCYGSCVFRSTWDDSIPERKMIGATPVKDHPFTQGFFCPKFSKRSEILYNSERIKSILLQSGKKGNIDSFNTLQKISEYNAWNLLLDKLEENIRKFGPESILIASYAENQGFLSMNSSLRFGRFFKIAETYGGICNEGGNAGLAKIFGNYTTTNPLQVKDPECNLIVVWKSNLSENNNHMYKLVCDAQKRGAKVVVIDSRKTGIAKRADFYLQPKFMQDHQVANLILKILQDINGFNRDFINHNVESFESIEKQLKQIQIRDLLKDTGLSFKKCQDLAELLIKNRDHTMILVGYGVNKDFFGGRMVQAIALLQIALGNFGKPGTGLVYSQSGYRPDLFQSLFELVTLENEYPPKKQYDLVRLAEVLEEGKIKCLIISNFNPVSSLPNRNRLEFALLRSDLFTVVCDIYPSSTMEFANMVFPMKYDVETWDLIKSYYIPGISINEAGPCPYPACISNHDFFMQLGRKLGNRLKLPESVLELFDIGESELVEQILEKCPQDVASNIKSDGYHLFVNEKTILNPELKFPTDSGKIELSSIKFKFLPSPIQSIIGKFRLYSPNHPRFLHSQLGVLNKSVFNDFQKVFVSPEDFSTLKVVINEKVRVSNQNGAGDFYIQPDSNLHSGIALIYSGGPIRKLGSPHVNIFTPDVPEELGHSGSYDSAFVKIEKIR
ncbi:MAG: molybdopterin-dependent oxidoreductase [Promethearchaeota archaeon]